MLEDKETGHHRKGLLQHESDAAGDFFIYGFPALHLFPLVPLPFLHTPYCILLTSKARHAVPLHFPPFPPFPLLTI
jgi:hypothetical protein